MRSDEELIAEYTQSHADDVADELISRHLAAIRGFVFRMVLNHAAADDLTQEVFLKAFRTLNSFQGRSKFSTWLFQVALNTTRTYLKRQGNLRVECRAELPSDVVSTHASPDGSVLHAELKSEIEVALSELSPSLRAAIVLTAMQGMDVGQAANIQGCSRATMYWRIHEARRRLSKKLAGYLSP